MKDGSPADLALSTIEPLARMSDLDEYRDGLNRRLGGEWDDERWTAYRVRFGIYGQKQPGVQMVRVKVPGGIIPTPWLKVVADVNREFGQGDAHITTRQDFQLYFVPLERTADMLEKLYSQGLTTREACGATLRNMTSCALSGVCPREHVDAGIVASRLARSWLRQPLVQHMPRKFKISVSGCGTDCGATSIHDLGFVAVEKDGQKGFRVNAAGGLGGNPRPAVTVFDFVAEDRLPTVVEAVVRVHHRYSDRVNRNNARIKFLVKRFGEDKFRALVAEEFERLSGLPQRPWEKLDWRQPSEGHVSRTPMGVLPQHDGTDGKVVIVVNLPLGLLSSDQLDALYAIAVDYGVAELRATRDQNIALPNIPQDKAAEVSAKIKAIGFDVPAKAEDVPDVISCPGTTTCRIGITNSQNFAKQVFAQAVETGNANGVTVRVSGCQNSCGLHHAGDFGFHGMGKKVDGQPAPHYQLHIGGNIQAGLIGLSGPIVPAKHADKALQLLLTAYAPAKAAGEPVRQWAERLGKPGLAEVLKPLQAESTEGVFLDWGETNTFAPPPQGGGDCAASFAIDDRLADLADDGLIRTDRALFAGNLDYAFAAAEDAAVYAARRLLVVQGQFPADEEPAEAVIGQARAYAIGNDAVTSALDGLLAQRDAALASGKAEGYREALAVWLDTVAQSLAQPEEAEAFDPAAFADL